MKFWDKIWRDRNGRGKVVIWQAPNWFLIGWAVLTFLSLFFYASTADALSRVGSISLIVWAALELTKGVNYFRRALGALVLLVSIMSLVHSF